MRGDADEVRRSSEVKGAWFTSARRYLTESGQDDVAERMIARLEPPHLEAFRDPIASAWYPEETLATTLRILREETRAERDERFVQVMQGITHVGLNRFFRLVLDLSSADFVLRKIPVMWGHIRRGAGKVEVQTDPRGATIRYSEFPWFSDPNYRLLTVGSIRTLLVACNTSGDVRVGESFHDALTIEITYR